MKKKRNTKKKKFIWIMAVLLFVVIGIGICRNINDGENYLVSTKNEKSLASEPETNAEVRYGYCDFGIADILWCNKAQVGII